MEQVAGAKDNPSRVATWTGRAFIGWLQFSPDGNRLAALEWIYGIRLWDLPLLRRELRTRGLDGEGPPQLER